MCATLNTKPYLGNKLIGIRYNTQLLDIYGSRKMARICEITQKKPMSGHNVSHANNKTKRRFLPNLQHRKFWSEGQNRWISLRLSNAALRTIDKNGIDSVLAKLRLDK